MSIFRGASTESSISGLIIDEIGFGLSPAFSEGESADGSHDGGGEGSDGGGAIVVVVVAVVLVVLLLLGGSVGLEGAVSLSGEVVREDELGLDGSSRSGNGRGNLLGEVSTRVSLHPAPDLEGVLSALRGELNVVGLRVGGPVSVPVGKLEIAAALDGGAFFEGAAFLLALSSNLSPVDSSVVEDSPVGVGSGGHGGDITAVVVVDVEGLALEGIRVDGGGVGGESDLHAVSDARVTLLSEAEAHLSLESSGSFVNPCDLTVDLVDHDFVTIFVLRHVDSVVEVEHELVSDELGGDVVLEQSSTFVTGGGGNGGKGGSAEGLEHFKVKKKIIIQAIFAAP